ncbi:hypothetical protein M758_UG102400 [Ceratodon purpureus]|nr:hypothetical protein M758_UG102400 [Ceratodon purpureus]
MQREQAPATALPATPTTTQSLYEIRIQGSNSEDQQEDVTAIQRTSWQFRERVTRSPATLRATSLVARALTAPSSHQDTEPSALTITRRCRRSARRWMGVRHRRSFPMSIDTAM